MLDVPMVIAILVTVICGGLVLYFLFLGGSGEASTKGGHGVVIAGLPGSGKTTLFYILGKGEAPPTISSTASQRAPVSSTDIKRGLNAVDVPGHENFKKEVIKEASHGKGVVFLVDSRNKQQIYKSANYLYDLFITKQLQDKSIGMLIVSNFQDDKASLDPEALRKELEKEIDRIKTSRKAFDTDPVQINDYLRNDSTPFSFDHVKGIRIKFCRAAVLEGKIDEIKEYLQKDIKY